MARSVAEVPPPPPTSPPSPPWPPPYAPKGGKGTYLFNLSADPTESAPLNELRPELLVDATGEPLPKAEHAARMKQLRAELTEDELYETEEVVELAYTGDSTISWLDGAGASRASRRARGRARRASRPRARQSARTG